MRFDFLRGGVRLKMHGMSFVAHHLAEEQQKLLSAFDFSDFGEVFYRRSLGRRLIVAAKLAIVEDADVVLPVEAVEFAPGKHLSRVVPRDEMVAEPLFCEMRFQVL